LERSGGPCPALSRDSETQVGRYRPGDHVARWYNNQRPTIGFGKAVSVPDWLNYELWQGPAPAKSFKDNLIHYNWHWFWHWGTGELGNNGIHALDVCRWGLGVDCPTRVTSGGGKYRYNDDQETPDTHAVTYEFGDKAITWEGRSWHKRGLTRIRCSVSHSMAKAARW
jgi:hypothetical protein